MLSLGAPIMLNGLLVHRGSGDSWKKKNLSWVSQAVVVIILWTELDSYGTEKYNMDLQSYRKTTNVWYSQKLWIICGKEQQVEIALSFAVFKVKNELLTGQWASTSRPPWQTCSYTENTAYSIYV